jgi:hypothetical protein
LNAWKKIALGETLHRHSDQMHKLSNGCISGLCRTGDTTDSAPTTASNKIVRRKLREKGLASLNTSHERIHI